MGWWRGSPNSDAGARRVFIITRLSLNSFPPMMRPTITGKIERHINQPAGGTFVSGAWVNVCLMLCHRTNVETRSQDMTELLLMSEALGYMWAISLRAPTSLLRSNSTRKLFFKCEYSKNSSLPVIRFILEESTFYFADGGTSSQHLVCMSQLVMHSCSNLQFLAQLGSH